MAGWAFTTERLEVRAWHEAGVADLSAVVAVMLTEPVTRWLPPDWQGAYTSERSASWIDARDAEGPVLLVVERESTKAVGLILLFEELDEETGLVDVRLGYLLAEHAWGRGLGRELLDGFVEQCRVRGNVRSVIGGVAPENTASIRLLERAGFERVVDAEPGAEPTYRLDLASTPSR